MTEKQSCEIPDSNPPGNEIKEILENSKTIAVVGLSDNPERDSYRVGKYMKDHGYTVIPVNPVKTEILGEKSYPDLSSIPSRVDIVDIFRNIEAIPGIVEEAIKIRAKVVWMQLGLAHNESARKAREAGLAVVQSKCLKIEHAKL
jgi:predicted CoA-binding protein